MFFFFLCILELAVSSKSDISVFKQNGDQKYQLHDLGTIVDVRQMENKTKVLINEDKRSLVLLELSEDKQEKFRQTFPFIPGVQKVLPVPSLDVIIAANETSLISVKRDFLVSEHLHQGRQILDITLDICHNSLIMIDKKEVFVSNLNNPLSFSQLLPKVNHAQLLASHSGRTIILTENQDKRLQNTDGFAILQADGTYMCGSDPAKAYNIRSIELIDTTLFMVDALNSLVWRLQLEETGGSICDLKVWTRISFVPQKLSILQRNQHVCISSKTSQDQRNSYFPPTQRSSIENIPTKSDPCHNYCLNGECSQTSLGIPVCHCGQNFTGDRCENEPCRNYCLNEGICTVLEISIGKVI